MVICCQYVMILCSLYQHNRLRLMRPRLSFCRQRARVHCAHPPAYNLQSLPLRKQGGRLWAQPCGRLSPCKLSILTICPSTVATAMLSVAGTRWRQKSGAFIASPGEKCGLVVCNSIIVVLNKFRCRFCRIFPEVKKHPDN